MKDIITGIREIHGGVRVTVNDSEILRLRSKDCKKHDLREGDAVDVRKLKDELLLEQYPDALGRAVRLLALRARSRSEIETWLTDACYLADTVEIVLTKLQGNGLLNDRTFAAQWARERSARQIGKARILHELRRKGVENALAEQAVAALDLEQQDANACKLAEKLAKRYRNDTAENARRKTIQAMLRRGYSYGEAKRALEEILGDTE
ncbi:MAG: regulatory protein RecX [Clostridiales bacterium]|nr:regulatory protein RecX [Clostridiales bacterium]